MKLGFFIADAWVIGFIVLTFLSLSRLLFDDPIEEHKGFGRFSLFITRILVAAIWPFALMSGGGRRKLLMIMKGE